MTIIRGRRESIFNFDFKTIFVYNINIFDIVNVVVYNVINKINKKGNAIDVNNNINIENVNKNKTNEINKIIELNV